MTEYPYDFGDGDDKKFTLQEVFFHLYDEWVDASEKWFETQNRKKEELRKMYPGTDAKSNEKLTMHILNGMKWLRKAILMPSMKSCQRSYPCLRPMI